MGALRAIDIKLKGSWCASGGSGYIVVYVTGAARLTASIVGISGITARKEDPYNGDKPIAKLVVNVM